MLVAVTAFAFPFVLMGLPLGMELLERRVLRQAGRHRRAPVVRVAPDAAVTAPPGGPAATGRATQAAARIAPAGTAGPAGGGPTETGAGPGTSGPSRGVPAPPRAPGADAALSPVSGG